jgi:GDP-4-dehydro-6-deoxy-D-mannose reductase
MKADLCDYNTIKEIICSIKPDAIIHLAGINNGTLKDLLSTNVVGTQNLLGAVINENASCRVLVISSSSIYGYSGECLINESQNYQPVTNYGISKAAQEMIALSYYKDKNLPVVIARPFNLIGPGQSDQFVCGHIISQIQRIKKGGVNDLIIREIESKRDFIDVRDAVEGYFSLIVHPEFEDRCAGHVFNISSGKSYSVLDIIHVLEEIIGKEVNLIISEQNPKNIVPDQRGNNKLITEITGWTPQIPIKKSMFDMLDYTRKYSYC